MLSWGCRRRRMGGRGDAPTFQQRGDLADVLGSWCCLNNGTHPNVVAMKARYTFFGAPRLTPADDAASRHGICGA